MSGFWTAPPAWGSNILTSAEMNTYLTDNEDYLKTHIDLEAAGSLVIAGGIVTVTQGYHMIDTEAGAPEDELDTIGGGIEGIIIVLRAEDAARTVVLKDATGNLILGGDIYLENINDHVALIYGADAFWHPFGGQFKIVKRFVVNDFSYPAPGTDWSPVVAGASLSPILAGKSCGLRASPIAIGDIIVSYKLFGDMVVVAAATLDCKLVKVELGHPPVETDVPGGAIVQVNVDGAFSNEAILTDPEVVAVDCQYSLIITGTTGVGDSIVVMGAEITILSL